MQEAAQIKFPIFLLDNIKNFKPFISLHASFLRECEQGKYKLYQPYIFENRIQLQFRNGDYAYLGTRISQSLDDMDKQ